MRKERGYNRVGAAALCERTPANGNFVTILIIVSLCCTLQQLVLGHANESQFPQAATAKNLGVKMFSRVPDIELISNAAKAGAERWRRQSAGISCNCARG